MGSEGAKLDDKTLMVNDWTEYYSSEFRYGRITVTGRVSRHFELVAEECGQV